MHHVCVSSCICHLPLYILCITRISDVAIGVEVEKYCDKYGTEEKTGVVCLVCHDPLGRGGHLCCSQRAFQPIRMGQPRSLAGLFLDRGWINHSSLPRMGN